MGGEKGVGVSFKEKERVIGKKTITLRESEIKERKKIRKREQC